MPSVSIHHPSRSPEPQSHYSTEPSRSTTGSPTVQAGSHPRTLCYLTTLHTASKPTCREPSSTRQPPTRPNIHSKHDRKQRSPSLPLAPQGSVHRDCQ